MWKGSELAISGTEKESGAIPEGEPAQPPVTEQGLPASATVPVKELGVSAVPAPEPDVFCLTIIGQIEGHIVMPPHNKTTKYEHIIPQLVAAEQSRTIKGLLIILNTVGGDVEAGLAIAEMIASLTKPTVTVVVGGGHSIGVPIAVAASHSVIAESATMTIHPIRMSGLIIGVPQTFEYMEKMQERVVRFVTNHSRITEEQFKDLMFKTGELNRDIGTAVGGYDAVKYGLMDEVGGIGTALARLNEMIAGSSVPGGLTQ